MREDLLVFFEPLIHGVPVEPDRIAKLLEGRMLIAQRCARRPLPAGGDGEELAVAAAGRGRDPAVEGAPLGANVGYGEVVGRVVGLLPDQQRADRVGDQLAAEVGTHPLRSVLDANSSPGYRSLVGCRVHIRSFAKMGLCSPIVGMSR